MIHVFDTSAFIVLKHFYPDTFASLWKGIEDLIRDGSLSSTREVYNELQNYNDSTFILDWAKRHKSVFPIPSPIPSNDELAFVGRIFAVGHFQALIGKEALLKGTPVADPFVIAAAYVRGGAVVSQEKAKPNAAKIPNVCAHFNIPRMDLAEFMRSQDWRF